MGFFFGWSIVVRRATGLPARAMITSVPLEAISTSWKVGFWPRRC